MKLIFDVSDKPKAGQLVVFALQQMLAILAATIAVPLIIGNGLTPAAAMFGAGVGTIVYIFFTKRKSPVFLGSSFAFLGSMAAAFAGGVSMQLGMLGLIVGAFLAGLVYVVIAIVVKFVGVGWLNKLMPAVVIGPTVAIIGLSLAGNAIGDLVKGDVTKQVTEYAVSTDSGTPEIIETVSNVPVGSSYVALICGLITLAVVMLCSTYGKKTLRLIPFIIGIIVGVIILIKVVNYLFNKHLSLTYSIIIGFVCGSTLSIFPGLEFSFRGILSMIFMVISFLLTNYLSKNKKKIT